MSQAYIPEVIAPPAHPLRVAKQLLNGDGVVNSFGYKQTKTVKLWWVDETDIKRLRDILDDYFPKWDGWAYQEPQVTPIIDTVKIYNVVAVGERYTKNG